jgi:hypothetical protein
MNCPDCGAFVSEADLFCGECGRPIVPTASPSEPPSLEEEQGQPTGGVILAPRSPKPSSVTPESKKKSSALVPILIGSGIALFLLCLFAGGIVAWIASTEQGESVPTRGDLLYEEDFSDPASGWEISSEDNTWADYVDGEYGLGVFQENYMVWGNPDFGLEFTNFEIEVDARQVEGPLDNNFGPLIRYQWDDESFYWFQISSDGYYSVDMRLGGEWATLVGWAESDAINQGLGAVNHLKVVGYGNQFSFYVNDTFLVDVSDDMFTTGNIGLAAGAFDEPGVVVHFDSLRVYALDE